MGEGNPIVGIIIVAVVVVVVIIVGLIWGLNAEASNCWEDEGTGDKFCDWQMTITISNIPVTNTDELFLPDLCAGFKKSIDGEKGMWAHIKEMHQSNFNQDIFLWTWTGVAYVRINMTDNSGGSNYDSSVLASIAAGTTARDNLAAELAKGETWGLGKSSVSAMPFASDESTRTSTHSSWCTDYYE